MSMSVGVSLDDLPDFLTVGEAAAVLRIGRTSAYLLCQRGRFSGGESGLPVVRIGRQLRVPRAALLRLAQSGADVA
jgi:excisionase family DNA binding protein